MGLTAHVTGVVRSKVDSVAEDGHGADGAVAVNPRGELMIACGLPGVADIVRMRQSYFVIQATAVAPIVAVPTTTAQVTLFNGEGDGGRCYVIDSFGTYVHVSAGAANEVSTLVCMGTGRKAAPTSDLVPRGLAGQRYRGAAIVDLAATVTNDTWTTGQGAIGFAPASQLGMNNESRPALGTWVIPPGHYFSVAAVSNTATTITVKNYIRWHEIQVPCAP